MPQVKHILLAFRLNYSSNRNFLAGIARYMKYAHNWHATIAENFYDFTNDSLSTTSIGNYDGIITVPPHDPNIARLLATMPVPVVILGAAKPSDIPPSPRGRCTFVGSDDRIIGELAARHFRSLGTFRSFAFVMPAQDVSWGKLRFAGFSKALSRHGIKAHLINTSHEAGSPEDIAYLKATFTSLPKPIAVMAAYDQRGTHILQACMSSAELSVPNRVQVIGVDNDSIFCDFARPTLTSISTNQIRKGEVAAMELARLMENPSARGKIILQKDAGIVERESTAPISPASHLIERAMEYIGRYATAGILPRDVTAHLGVSHALISKRLRDFGYDTLSETIARTRLKAVRSKLRTTKLKIAAVTAACGFENADYAKRLFKKTYGITMREYRNLGASPQNNR